MYKLKKLSVGTVKRYYAVLNRIGFGNVMTQAIQSAAPVANTGFGSLADQVNSPSAQADTSGVDVVLNLIAVTNAIWEKDEALNIAQIIFEREDKAEITEADLDEIDMDEFSEGLRFFANASFGVTKGLMSSFGDSNSASPMASA